MSGSIATQARQTVAELALAARSGPVGPATVLAYTARLHKLLLTLAEFETISDELADEARELHEARHAALHAGTVIAFPIRPKMHVVMAQGAGRGPGSGGGGTGGHAA